MFEFTFHVFISSDMLQEVLCYFWHERMRFLRIPEIMKSLKMMKTLFHSNSMHSRWLFKQVLLTCIQGFMLAETLDTISAEILKLFHTFLL